jgi:hypothetical protein
MMRWLRGWVRKVFGVRVVRGAAMTDAELLAAFDVAADHDLYRGMMELLERGKEQCLGEADAAVGSKRECEFYLGGRYALARLQDYVANLREEAERKRVYEQRL